MFVMQADPVRVHTVAFAPSGELVVFGTEGLSHWAVPDRIRTEKSLLQKNSQMVVTPDGRYVVLAGGHGSIEIFRQTEPRYYSLLPVAFPVSAVAAVNNRTLAVGAGRAGESFSQSCTLFLVDLEASKLTRTTFGVVNGIRALSTHVETRRLAWATDNQLLHVQDMTRPVAKGSNTPKEATCISFSPDGRYLGVGVDWSVGIYELRSWPCRPSVSLRHQGPITSIAFCPDNQTLISGSWDQTVRMWDLSSGAEKQRYDFGIDRITSVAVAGDGMRGCAGSAVGKVAVWDIDE